MNSTVNRSLMAPYLARRCRSLLDQADRHQPEVLAALRIEPVGCVALPPGQHASCVRVSADPGNVGAGGECLLRVPAVDRLDVEPREADDVVLVDGAVRHRELV